MADQPVKIIGLKALFPSEVDILLCTVKGKLLVFRKKMVEKSMIGTASSFLIIKQILFQHGFDIFLLKHEKNDFKFAVMQLLVAYIFIAQAALTRVVGYSFIFNLQMKLALQYDGQFIKIVGMESTGSGKIQPACGGEKIILIAFRKLQGIQLAAFMVG